jgi:hypothetical protein
MSLFGQGLWAVLFILFGIAAILSAYHFKWINRVFPFAFFPLLAVMFIIGWRYKKNRNDKDLA